MLAYCSSIIYSLRECRTQLIIERQLHIMQPALSLSLPHRHWPLFGPITKGRNGTGRLETSLLDNN